MGAHGVLRVANRLTAVSEATAGSAAADVPAVAPRKPVAVADDPDLSAVWDEVVPSLDRAGLVSVSDAPAIELALRHFLMARRSAEQIGEEIVVADAAHEGVKKNPAEAVFRAESLMFLKYAGSLGMTFVSRARTPAKGGSDEQDNPFESGSQAAG